MKLLVNMNVSDVKSTDCTVIWMSSIFKKTLGLPIYRMKVIQDMVKHLTSGFRQRKDQKVFNPELFSIDNSELLTAQLYGIIQKFRLANGPANPELLTNCKLLVMPGIINDILTLLRQFHGTIEQSDAQLILRCFQTLVSF